MTISYFILYCGKSADATRFRTHYVGTHVPILLRFPGALSVTTHFPVRWSDPKGVQEGQFELIAQIEFVDLDSLNSALESDQRALARADMDKHFPHFDGSVWHQATQSERTLP